MTMYNRAKVGGKKKKKKLKEKLTYRGKTTRQNTRWHELVRMRGGKKKIKEKKRRTTLACVFSQATKTRE